MFISKLRAFIFPNVGVSRLAVLDGARGLAVLLVLLDHASDAGMQIAPGMDLNRLGKYGVYLFFVLSAFLLTHQCAVRPAEQLEQRGVWLDYALRRFLRIFPVYTAVLIAMWLMGKLEFGEIGQHLLLREGVGPYWSIPVEVKFYLVLPFIALALFWAGRRHWFLGLAACAVPVAAGAGIIFLEQRWSPHERVWLGPNLAPFLLGAATALGYGALLRRERLRQRLALWLELAAWGVVVATLLRVPSLYNLIVAPENELNKFADDPLVCGVLWSIFLLGLLCGRGTLAGILTWGPLRYLGFISFSAYLWHRKFLNDVDDLPVPPVVRLLVFLGIVIAVATVSYALFERPFSKVRWTPRPPLGPAPVERPVPVLTERA